MDREVVTTVHEALLGGLCGLGLWPVLHVSSNGLSCCTYSFGWKWAEAKEVSEYQALGKAFAGHQDSLAVGGKRD